MIAVIDWYQKHLSPDHSDWAKSSESPPFCKFYPSCSEYAKIAIIQNGAFKWGLQAVWRICRCNPFSRGGIDFPDQKN